MIPILDNARKYEIIAVERSANTINYVVTVSLVFDLNKIDEYTKHDERYTDGNGQYEMLDFDEDDFKAWGTWRIGTLNDKTREYLFEILATYFAVKCKATDGHSDSVVQQA